MSGGWSSKEAEGADGRGGMDDGGSVPGMAGVCGSGVVGEGTDCMIESCVRGGGGGGGGGSIALIESEETR